MNTKCRSLFVNPLILAVFAVAILTASGHATADLPRPAAQLATVSWTYTIEAQPGTKSALFRCTLPRTLPDRQTVKSLNFVPTPTKRFIDGGTEYAQFDFPNPQPKATIQIDAQIELYRCDLATLSRKARSANKDDPAPDLSAWLKPERMLECDQPDIVAVAEKIPNSKGAAGVRNVMNAALSYLKWSNYMEDDHGALWALKNGRGDCSEHSDLFVTLCRAKGIPALVTEGYVITPVKPGDTPKHAWAEAYIEGIGWTPFDPFHITCKICTFDSLSPTRIVTSVRRSDPNLKNYHHWYYEYRGKPITVKDSFVVKQLDVLGEPKDK